MVCYFSNTISFIYALDRSNYQAPSVKSSCGYLVLCGANSSSELHGKLVIIANCEEAPTLSGWSESTLAKWWLRWVPEWIICAKGIEGRIKVFSIPPLEYAKALRAGSTHGGVSAIFDEVPYLNTFLVQYGSEFQIVGHIDSYRLVLYILQPANSSCSLMLSLDSLIYGNWGTTWTAAVF